MVSRLVVGITAALSTMALVASRHIRRSTTASRVAAGHDCKNVLIVGSGSIAQALHKHLNENKQLGYLVKGFLDRRGVFASAPTVERRQSTDSQILGTIDDLSALAREHFVDEILITTPEDRELVKRIASEARECGLGVRVMLDLYDGLAWRAPVEFSAARGKHCLPAHLRSVQTLQSGDRNLSWDEHGQQTAGDACPQAGGRLNSAYTTKIRRMSLISECEIE